MNKPRIIISAKNYECKTNRNIGKFWTKMIKSSVRVATAMEHFKICVKGTLINDMTQKIL